jgi:hypothetical protein
MVKSNSKKQPRAKITVSYVRATTIKQSGISVPQQQEAIKKKTQELNIKIVDKFADIGPLSIL